MANAAKSDPLMIVVVFVKVSWRCRVNNADSSPEEDDEDGKSFAASVRNRSIELRYSPAPTRLSSSVSA